MAASRRKFLGALSVGGASVLTGSWAPKLADLAKPTHSPSAMARHPARFPFTPVSSHSLSTELGLVDRHPDNSVLDNLALSRTWENTYDEAGQDEILTAGDQIIMRTVFNRMKRVQALIGYGNFNVVSWDDTLQHARDHSSIGGFEANELAFIEKIFSMNVATIGFYGDKVVNQLSSTIPKKDIQKVPGTGHFLYKGEALNTYKRIRQDIGNTVVLTSGIRSVVKQIYLFLNKAIEVGGNLSLASYSLAPPGHSYHAVGDFDVGKVGFGRRNFTDDFSTTDEFKRLSEFGYFDIRYPQNNPYGVRYEPWHIKVV